MNYTITITSVRVFPQIAGYANVIAKAGWTIDFEHNGFTSRGMGETTFNVDDIQSFTPFEEVTKEQLVGWIIEREGGQQFIDMLTQIHGAAISAKALDAATQPASMPFVQPPSPPVLTYNLQPQAAGSN